MEAPIATTRFPRFTDIRSGFAWFSITDFLILLILALEAIFIFTRSSLRTKSSNCFLLDTAGLATKSTAPAFMASNTLSLRELITTTGSGYWGMSFRRNSIPFILGSSMSSVITSGFRARIASLASKGSLAVPTTCIAGSLPRFWTSSSRNTMESSTIKTLIGSIYHPVPLFAFLSQFIIPIICSSFCPPALAHFRKMEGWIIWNGVLFLSMVSVVPMNR